jgi:large subunit ribosomal protein L21e
VFHGKTGVIYNVSKSSVGVILQKQVGNRFIEKRVNVRIEHIRSSRSREDFLRRVKTNAAAKKEAKAKGEKVEVKRQPLMPRTAHTVGLKANKPETIVPIAYDTAI